MLITGFHSIEERLKKIAQDLETGTINSQDFSNSKIFYSKIGPRIKKILSLAKLLGLKIENKDEHFLDSLVLSLSENLRDHRGIVFDLQGELSKENFLALDFDEWIFSQAKSNSKKTVLILDSIFDPHNVGAILRSCDQFGVDLVVLPEHKGVKNILQNQTILKSSAGAASWVSCCTVVNLARALESLKSADFWIYGAQAFGENLFEIEFEKKIAIILGSEGKGLSKNVRMHCEKFVRIPTCGKIDSLNVSVAAGILLYERSRKNFFSFSAKNL